MSYLFVSTKFFVKTKNKILTLSLLILTLSLLNIILSQNIFAVQLNLYAEVTPALNITMSSSDIVIDNLHPGQSGDSNIVTISIDSNNSRGFTLFSTVGNSENDYTQFKDGTGGVFSAVQNTVPSHTDLSSNEWGYSASPNDLNSWSEYSALPLYTEPGEILLNTTSSGSATVNFKIGAKASPTKAAGNYTNVINFLAVAAPSTLSISNILYMQDFATLSGTEKWEVMSSMTEDESYQLADSRDHKIYHIAKLKDGNVWMVQNLDHDIDDERMYTSADTDLPENETWTPLLSTQETSDISGQPYYTQPTSYDIGDLCWNKTLADNSNWNSIDPADMVTACGQTNPYHLGNYYNYPAAVAINQVEDYIPEEIPIEQSICPAGWTLPRANSGALLANFYGRNQTTGYLEGGYSIWENPINFVLGGIYIDGGLEALNGIGAEGDYWTIDYEPGDFTSYTFSGTSENGIFEDIIYATNYRISVRCVLRQ